MGKSLQEVIDQNGCIEAEETLEKSLLLSVLIDLLDNHVSLVLKFLALNIYCRLKLSYCNKILAGHTMYEMRRIVNSCISSLETDYTMDQLKSYDLGVSWSIAVFYYNYDALYYCKDMPDLDVTSCPWDLERLMTKIKMWVG